MWDHHYLLYFAMTFISMYIGAMGSKGDIRCYCNLPVCVATGYMCKSSSGACFSEVSSQSDLRGRSRHGCVELLHPTRRETCQKRVHNTKVNFGKFPLLVCCQEDMCNYVDSLDIKIHVNTKVNNNRSYPTGQQHPSSITDGDFLFGSNSADHGISRQDLWFKAAVIAVPIAGGFILIMLILLAVHMLRKDNRRQRQMLESQRLRQFKAHLLVNDHLVNDKNETNAKLNQLDRSSNVYKNVNIVITRDICNVSENKKQMNYEVHNKPLNNTFCNAVVTWGELGRKSSTPV